MAANDEFPRGWTLNHIENSSGVACQVTVPAVAGVAHVLDHILAKAVNYTAASPAAGGLIVSILLGGFTVLSSLLQVPAGQGDDTLDLEVHLATVPGGTIQAKMSFAPGVGTTQWQEITLQGHDI